MKITNQQILEIAKNNGMEYAILKAFIEVESGGRGFNTDGKIIIQFEPKWFKDLAPYAPSGKWSLNKVEKQSQEWIAFNDAFRLNPNAAMMATSIGMPQILGYHYKTLGYKSVGDMWDDFKRGEYQQVLALVRFIKANNNLWTALQTKNWHRAASIYNGASYKQMAILWGREPYDISLEKAYKKYQ